MTSVRRMRPIVLAAIAPAGLAGSPAGTFNVCGASCADLAPDGLDDAPMPGPVAEAWACPAVEATQ